MYLKIAIFTDLWHNFAVVRCILKFFVAYRYSINMYARYSQLSTKLSKKKKQLLIKFESIDLKWFETEGMKFAQEKK